MLPCQDQHTRLSCAYCQEEQPISLQLLQVLEAAAGEEKAYAPVFFLIPVEPVSPETERSDEQIENLRAGRSTHGEYVEDAGWEGIW